MKAVGTVVVYALVFCLYLAGAAAILWVGTKIVKAAWMS